MERSDVGAMISVTEASRVISSLELIVRLSVSLDASSEVRMESLGVFVVLELSVSFGVASGDKSASSTSVNDGVEVADTMSGEENTESVSLVVGCAFG